MDAALLIFRLVVGLLLAGHGAQKLFGVWGGQGLRGMSAFLHARGFRPAFAWAALGGLAEFGGGLLFAAGLFTPLGSIGIGAAMLMAIARVHWPKVWASEGGFEYPLVVLAVAVGVGIAGPGALALDARLGTALPPVASALVMVVAGVGYLIGMVASAATLTSGAADAATRPGPRLGRGA
jgi:putative oxidoreductase